MFITFEGADGGGKSTQIELLATALREMGYEVVTSREPGGTPLAEKVRNLVLDPQLPLSNKTQSMLFLAARSEHVDKLIKPALDAGKIVLCDRFSDSTLVYQGLANGKQLEELVELRQLNDYATGGLRPDLTLVMDGRPEKLARRRDARGVTDRFEEQGLAFQHALRAGFQTLAKAEPERIKVIDAEGAIDEIAQQILAVVKQGLANELKQ